MKRFFTLLILLGCVGVANAQPWSYNFGTATATHTASSTILSTAGTFLPAVPSGGGTGATRNGTGSGAFHLENPGTTLGSGTELRGVAPSGGSVSKFHIYDYTAAKSFSIKFSIRFDGGASGTWYFFNGDGSSLSTSTTTFTGSHIFTGLRFVYGASGAITPNYRAVSTWTALPSNPFTQGTNYVVEIYGNNSTSTINYDYGTAQSVAANTFDLWVDGVLIGDDLAKAQLGNDVNIDSWMFYGESSTANVANIYLDDIIYSNSIPASAPLPIDLLSFTAKKLSEKVKVQWTTATEINNDKFIIERSVSGEDYEFVSEVKGAGNSKEINKYEIVDHTPLKGTSYYRLTQVDFDGRSETFAPVAVKMDAKSMEVVAKSVEQGSINLNVFSPNAGDATLVIRDLSGRTIVSEKIILTEGYQNFNINSHNLQGGIHLIQLVNGAEVVVKKLVL